MEGKWGMSEWGMGNDVPGDLFIPHSDIPHLPIQVTKTNGVKHEAF
jgi:hypothetical protein